MADSPYARWLAVLLAVGICYFSVFSSPDAGVSSLGPLGLVGMDKWYHAVGYGVLAVVLASALSGRRHVALLAIGSATGFGIAMEVAQSFVPGRHAGVGDAIADALGATIAVALWWLVARRDEADLRA